MKITVQEKIAELERRIVALESVQSRPPTVTKTTTTTTAPMTAVDQGHLTEMWSHFDGLFKEMGKLFR